MRNDTLFVSKQGDKEFLDALSKAIIEAEEVDTSVILDIDNAWFMFDVLVNSGDKLITETFADNDFGSKTGTCLLTAYKNEDGFLHVIVEDVANVGENGEQLIKFHEVDKLFVLSDLVDVDVNKILGIYETNQNTMVQFEDKYDFEQEVAQLIK